MFFFFIIENFTANETSNKQSTTSSYISDDCKVLYIETVIEVAKPVYYERTTDTITTKDTQYHHHTSNHSQRTATFNRSKYLMDKNNNHHQQRGDSTDDDTSARPVPNPPTVVRRHSNKNHAKHQGDSGIEYDQTSSSSTICNQLTTKDQPLFPPAGTDVDEPSTSSLLRNIKRQTETGVSRPSTSIYHNQTQSSWNRPKKSWFRSLLAGLIILLLLFFVYLSGLDRCSRSSIIRIVLRSIISIENEGLPTI